jgi:hypothetical protein
VNTIPGTASNGKNGGIPLITHFSKALPNPAIQQFAKEKGVSTEVAANQIEKQLELTQFADMERSKKGFAGFRIVDTSDGPRGQLAKTSSEPTTRRRKDVDFFDSPYDEKSLLDVDRRLTAALLNAGVSNVQAVSFDVFESKYVVWKTAVPLDPSGERTANPTVAEAEWAVISNAELNAGTALGPNRSAANSVRDDLAPQAKPVMGGRTMSLNGTYFFFSYTAAECTSSFGLYNPGSGLGAYMTAGHCVGCSNWTANGNPVISCYASAYGGYIDRVFFQANGANWVVFNGNVFEDMASQPTHVYQGAFYCSYSRKQYGQQCGTISAVNIPITNYVNGFGFQTVWTTRGSSNMRCAGGDSGGPLWQPRSYQESIPAGTIEAGLNDPAHFEECLFLALDDQLRYTGWVLL